MTTVLAIAASDATTPLANITIERRAIGPKDVDMEIHYCGICMSDVHQVRSDWGATIYPVVPGHEITGVVRAVGSEVTKFAVGDRVGVGCLVDSCRSCEQCGLGDEQYCPKHVFTYNDKGTDGLPTYGGYSQSVVVNEHFVLHIPDSIGLAEGAPLLCAGITTFSPLKHWGATSGGKRIGIAGFGGLGHMAVKYAKAMGNEVFVFTTTERKRAAIEELGATAVLLSDGTDAVASSLDLILNTTSAQHTLDPFLYALKPSGVIVLLGAPPQPFEISAGMLLHKRYSVAGSLIGGIAETQEMLEFSAANGITPDVELINADQVNDAFSQIITQSNLKPRFVIKIKESLL